MTGTTSNKPIGLAVFIWIITFTILGYGIYLFGVNYRYILTGESIDLDEYIEKSVDDLPFGKIVDMTITESYGSSSEIR